MGSSNRTIDILFIHSFVGDDMQVYTSCRMPIKNVITVDISCFIHAVHAISCISSRMHYRKKRERFHMYCWSLYWSRLPCRQMIGCVFVERCHDLFDDEIVYVRLINFNLREQPLIMPVTSCDICQFTFNELLQYGLSITLFQRLLWYLQAYSNMTTDHYRCTW